jgi:hypothetical protein
MNVGEKIFGPTTCWEIKLLTEMDDLSYNTAAHKLDKYPTYVTETGKMLSYK